MMKTIMTHRTATPERTGWRCEWISRRHREWHPSLAMCDLDFLCIEYRNSAPVALIEYKAMSPRELQNASLSAVSTLADLAQLPFFVTFYLERFPAFWVEPRNERARQMLETSDAMPTSERDYVDFLFALRGEVAPAGALDKLSTYTPQNDVQLRTSETTQRFHAEPFLATS
jgi:hypothetical protein